MVIWSSSPLVQEEEHFDHLLRQSFLRVINCVSFHVLFSLEFQEFQYSKG